MSAGTAAANKKARQDKLDAEASADKKRDQSYEDELRSLEIQKQKLALAKEEANEMGVQIRITSGPAIEKPGDLAALLTNLQEGDVLFIDEIHRLSRQEIGRAHV